MKFVFRHIVRVTFLAVGLVAVTACGGGSSPPPSVGETGSGGPPNQYMVVATVSGLVGQGLTLQLSGAEDLRVLEISSSGDFDFASLQTSWDVTRIFVAISIKQQPHSPAQHCVVRNGSFLMSAGNTDVNIVCAEFFYMTDAVDNTISAFSVDATTGAIAPGSSPVTAGTSPYVIGSAFAGEYLYVANSGSNNISLFARDASGTLTAVPGSPFAVGSNPKSLSISTFFPSGDYSTPPQDRNVAYLYVANAGSDDISAFGVNRDNGILTPLSPTSYATGPRPSAMAVHPSQEFLYTANTGGSNDISAFLIGGGGGLTQMAGSPFPSGGNVSSLAFGGSGNFLYAADASGGAAVVFGYSVDPVGGALTSLAGFPFPLPSCDYIVADQTGTYLYATGGTNVFGYSIDANTGALNPLPGFPVAVGATADSVTIDPTNQFLYVRNGSAGTITGFELNGATGGLTRMPGSPFAVGRSADFIATF